MKRLSLTFLCLISVVASFAYDALVEGVYYNMNKDERTAEVTNETGFGWSYSYSGSVVIPETITVDDVSYAVTSIGANAFSGCYDLTSVAMPNTVTTISMNSFFNCDALSSIVLSKSLKYIGSYAFSGCMKLTSVEIPNSVTNIDNSAFEMCYGLTSLIIGSSVETIGRGAFASCTGLTSLEIPNSVISIGEDAFSGCSKLVTVTLGKSLKSIEANTFSNCSALTTLVVDDNPYLCVEDKVLYNKDMSRLIFCLPTKSGNYSVPNSVSAIANAAFYKCVGLTSIEIPNSVTSIGEDAFIWCNGLASIEMPNSVTSIGEGAFIGCNGLTSLVVDNGNQYYCTEDNVLYNKDKSELLVCLPGREGNYVIPTSVKAIGAYAFFNCGLTSIEISNSVVNIGRFAFADCGRLTSVVFSNTLKTIEDGAFSGCSSLTSVEIPNSVTSIGNSSFIACSMLASISLPRSLTDIGSNAFMGCEESLVSVKVGWEAPIGINFFIIGFHIQVIGERTSLYVPRGAKEAYAAAFGWNFFKEIIEYDYTEDTDGIPCVSVNSTSTVGKHLVNGRLVIQKNGKLYDASGAELK